MVSAEITGTNRVLTFLESLKPGTRQAVRDEMNRQAVALQKLVVKGYLTGQVLNVRTGHLRRSIAMKVKDDGQHFEGIVGTKVLYGRFWELGFDRRVGYGTRGGPKSIIEKFALFRYMIKHPQGVKHFAPRAFLKPALDERRLAIQAALVAAVEKAVKA